MNKFSRYSLLLIYLIGSLSTFLIIYFYLKINLAELFSDWAFLVMICLFAITIEEFYVWAKNGKRSELSDLIAMAFFFFIIYVFTKDILTSIMGAFSIYLWIGVIELKEYPIINKLLTISLITYNLIFIAGVISSYLEKSKILTSSIVLDTTFAFSFWIILGLGFLLFGRKYLIVWRFMSPQYLVIFLYIIGWLFVVFLSQFINPILLEFNIKFDLLSIIYVILIVINIIIYFISGAFIDKLLGIKEVKDEKLLNIVEEVKKDIGIKGKVRVGFGKYPILNAQAYGPFFNKRIAIIANDIENIKEDELKGIIAHELAHTKGNHILILTFITIGDLIVRYFLKIPATFYDYTFGNPQIPLIYFIIINIGIYIILYFFVRILEGYADLRTKEAGYKIELTKALYNLESFYASGRETGLNTMLLCEEKITKDNQLLDYIDTAKYISHSMVKPSRISLLGNFINSHPPSYHRIAAILGDDINPYKEAILPLLCAKNSKRIKYGKKFEKQVIEFKEIANNKFKELFDIEDISNLLKDLKIRDLYKDEFEKDYLFKNIINSKLILGKIKDIEFIDDISDTFQYKIENLKNNKIEYLNSFLYPKTEVKFGNHYVFNKDIPLILQEIEFNKENNDGNYVFVNNNEEKVLKPIKKTKLPISLDLIKTFQGKDLFLKSKGILQITECINVKKTGDTNYTLELMKNHNNNSEKEIFKLSLKDLIVRPKNIYYSIRKSERYKKSETELLNWLLNNKIRSYFYLKKPVNNVEIGYLKEISKKQINFDKNKKTKNEESETIVIIENIFNKTIELSLKQLDLISFSYDSAMIQLKSETSGMSKIGYKILKKIKPDKIMY